MTKKSTTKVVPVASPLLGRSKEAGCKIVIADKAANRTREGSKNELFFSIIFESKTTDAAVAQIREHMDKPWDVIRMAVKRGYIRLEPVAAKGAAPKAAVKDTPVKEAPAKKTARKSRTAGRRAADKVTGAIVAAVQKVAPATEAVL